MFLISDLKVIRLSKRYMLIDSDMIKSLFHRTFYETQGLALWVSSFV